MSVEAIYHLSPIRMRRASGGTETHRFGVDPVIVVGLAPLYTPYSL